MKNSILIINLLLSLTTVGFAQDSNTTKPGLKKIKDVVIYKNAQFYSAFPSVIKRPDGELIVGFRRAPDRKIFGESGSNHTDPNSYLVMVRSDDGENWTKSPELIHAHPFGGSQDPASIN